MEKWLYSFLCLDCASTPYRLMSGTPHPDHCQLFAVNRDALFSYHKLSEAFLQRVWSLYVSSHYKNSPDDLQLLSDAPAHRLFVLLGPVKEDQPLPDVYCVVQVCLEGRIGKETVRRELSKGTRSAGDMIPWIVSQQFLDSDFSQLSGARIVRIATHPDVQGMGYGRRALQQLQDYFQGRVQWSGEEEETLEEEAPQGLDAEAKPRKHLPPLLVSLSDRKPERLHVGVRESGEFQWLGVSFGLTEQLFNFYEKEGYAPVYLRQTENELTGEHSCVLIKVLLFPLSHAASRHRQSARRAGARLAGVLRRRLPAPLRLAPRLPVRALPRAPGAAPAEPTAGAGERVGKRGEAARGAADARGGAFLPDERRPVASGVLRAQPGGLSHDHGPAAAAGATVLRAAAGRGVAVGAAGDDPHRTGPAAQDGGPADGRVPQGGQQPGARAVQPLRPQDAEVSGGGNALLVLSRTC